MRYVIIRDDDTNALTPVSFLERLYRPFLDKGLPVNLAVIPAVNTAAKMADGRPEGFLLDQANGQGRTVAMSSNGGLVNYLRDNSGFHVVQHGCHHDFHEFDCESPTEAAARLERGSQLLMDAGFPKPRTFVAPYDKLSRASLHEVAERFSVLSTGWFELGRLPYSWWPNYAVKKLRRAPHWQVGQTLLLSHPGCLLSCYRPYDTMLDGILRCVQRQQITVLVTHWWEYFPSKGPDEPFIGFLHETADYLASNPDIKVIPFSELVSSRIRLN
jgi:hypothetical protein